MKKLWLVLYLLTMSEAKDYSQNDKVQKFIDRLVSESRIDKDYLEKLFSEVQVSKSSLRVYRVRKKPKAPSVKATKPMVSKKPSYGTWEKYSRYRISDSMATKGLAFIKKNQEIFDKVAQKYGVEASYLCAIIGIETMYGKNVGKYRVFDVLVTLAFEKNRRNTFFKKQLKKFLQLAHTEKFNPKNVRGSYAGAIGLGQFMPSNYEAYGVDYDGDGHITLQKTGDAIASVANYLKQNGWRRGEEVATRARYEGKRFDSLETGYKQSYLAEELKGITARSAWKYEGKIRLIKLNTKHYDALWFGAKNFFVITRYNHSAYYAMSVHQLAVKIQKKRDEN